MRPGEISKGAYVPGKDGRGIGQAPGWKCPQCAAMNVGQVADGCVSCGAGTEAQRELVAHRKVREVSDEEFEREVGTAPNFTSKAVATVAQALAHYSEHGVPGTGLLSPAVMVKWARRLMEGLGE